MHTAKLIDGRLGESSNHVSVSLIRTVNKDNTGEILFLMCSCIFVQTPLESYSDLRTGYQPSVRYYGRRI